MKKKVTYIVSGINRSLAFEWIAEELNKDKFDLTFILLYNGKSEMESVLNNIGVKVLSINYKGKISIPFVLLQLIYLLIKDRPHVIHTHLFEATFLGSFVGKLIGIKKRVQTRHHATSNIVYHPNGVKWDKFCSYLATTIVAPSENVANTLVKLEGVDKKKVEVIYHGFRLEDIETVSEDRVLALRHKYDIADSNGPIVGVISRYLELKGIQYVIPAFQRLLSNYPNAKLILINAKGPFKSEVHRMLKKISPDRYIEIEFENDVFALYKLFDLFVHVPVDDSVEAFGQIYVEALASGIPSVFTMSGIAKEFIVPNNNAVVVPFRSEDDILKGMEKILADDEFRRSIVSNGRKDLAKFRLENFIDKLERLYE